VTDVLAMRNSYGYFAKNISKKIKIYLTWLLGSMKCEYVFTRAILILILHDLGLDSL